jgi:flavin-dependent dehydrogenase
MAEKPCQLEAGFQFQKLYGDGWMVIGDSASLVDVQKLKGIHLSIKSGMAAAETAIDCLLADDFSAAKTQGYETRVHNSYIKRELFKVRNFHQTLGMGIFTFFTFTGAPGAHGWARSCGWDEGSRGCQGHRKSSRFLGC